MAALLSPICQQNFDNDGNVAASGRLYTTLTGTTTHRVAYTDQAGTTSQTYVSDGAGGLYIALDSAGRIQPSLWLAPGVEYRLRLTNSAGTLIDEWDDIYGITSTDGFRSVASYGTVGDGTTSDQTAVAAAVAAAYSAGDWLYWPDGTYLTTATVPNFHDVKHWGPGVVKRGSDLFYITPTSSQVNNIYVNVSTGANTNDGITSSQPRQTLQSGIDVLSNWTHALDDGYWKIQLAAGTYAKGAFPNSSNTAGLISRNPLYIVGPDVSGHPNVPTALIKEGATEAGTGINCSFTKVYLKDLKIEDYNGSVSSQGVLGGNGSDLYLENVHLEDCYYGVTVGGPGSVIDAKGGIWNDCGLLNSTTTVGSGGAACRMIFIVKSEIGNQSATTTTEGPFITNCVNGIFAQEHVTGHVDYCLFEDNGNAIYALLNSRINTNSSEFNRNSVCGRADNGSNIDMADASNTFGTGADVNSKRIVCGVDSRGAHTAVLDGENVSLGHTEIRFKATYADTVTSSTSSGNTIDSFTVKGGWCTGSAATGRPAPKIRFRMSGSISGTAGTKSFSIRLGSAGPTASVTLASGLSGIFEVNASCDFEQTAKQLLRASANTHVGSVYLGLTEATIDMTTDQPIYAHAYVANAADSITINALEWWISGF